MHSLFFALNLDYIETYPLASVLLVSLFSLCYNEWVHKSIERSMPKVSVLMPVYNTEESYLREAIESILNQTFSDFEFIILNDGSTNNAQDVILSYSDSRINYVINEKNLGLIKTLNKGFDLAKGEYIARMDSDDISLPERFQKQVNFMDENPNVHVVGTWYEWFPKCKVQKPATNDKAIKECLLASSNSIAHPTVMLRKSVIDNLQARYDENFAYVEDYALWLSLIDKVDFANIDEILLKYRIHPNSVCKVNKRNQILNVYKLMAQTQGKYFGIDYSKILDIISKLKTEKISSKELLELNEFSKLIKTKAQEKGFVCEYEMNKDFYKLAIRNCKKDLLFLKLLWTSELNKPLKLRFGFKIINSIF